MRFRISISNPKAGTRLTLWDWSVELDGSIVESGKAKSAAEAAGEAARAVTNMEKVLA